MEIELHFQPFPNPHIAQDLNQVAVTFLSHIYTKPRRGAPSVPPSHSHHGNADFAHLLSSSFGDGVREASLVTTGASSKNSLLLKPGGSDSI